MKYKRLSGRLTDGPGRMRMDSSPTDPGRGPGRTVYYRGLPGRTGYNYRCGFGPFH